MRIVAYGASAHSCGAMYIFFFKKLFIVAVKTEFAALSRELVFMWRTVRIVAGSALSFLEGFVRKFFCFKLIMTGITGCGEIFDFAEFISLRLF